jgi:hypothetical protein
MSRRRSFAALAGAVVLLAAAAPPAAAQRAASLPVDRGETVMTHSSMSGSGGIRLDVPVVRLFDVRDPVATGDSPPNGTNFPAPAYPDYPASAPWNATELGQVFGVTLDDAPSPNVYVTAASIYGIAGPRLPGGAFVPGQFAATPGTVFQLDGTTGAVTAFANVPSEWCDGRPRPNSGPALGQIAFDAAHDQLFVSDFDDGVIYRVGGPGHATPGAILGCYDHGRQGLPVLGDPTVLDDGSAMDATYYSANTGVPSGFTSLERRVWAVQVYEGRLYYSTWREDKLRSSAAFENRIYSVPILPSGATDPSGIQLEVHLPAFEIFSYSNPVADIAISEDGRMLASERTMFGDVGPGDSAGGSWAHQSRVIEYRLVSGSWVQEPINKHQIGNDAFVGFPSHQARNSEGGVDWNGEVLDEDPDVGACDSTVVATGDGLNGGNPSPGPETYIYGFQLHPASGSDINYAGGVNALLVDWDNSFNGFDDKSSLGSLEAHGPECRGGGGLSCVELLDLEITCLGNGIYQVTFQVTNTSPFTVPADHIRILLPNGGPPIELPLAVGGAPGLPQGATSDPASFTFQSDLAPGEEYCFTYQLVGQDTDGDGFPQWACQKTAFCLTIPECPPPGGESCATILDLEITCLGDGTYQVTFQVRNDSPFSVPAGGIRIFLPGGGPPLTLPLTTGGNPGVPTGQVSDPVTFTFTSAAGPGSVFCFTYQLIGLDTDGNGFPQWSCEKTQYCVILPDCPEDCLDLGEADQDWRRVFGVNGVRTQFPVVHGGPTAAGHAGVTPLTPGVAVTGPMLVPTPLPPGPPGGTVQFFYAGPGATPGATLQFRIDVHDCDDATNGFCEWCCTALLELVVPPRALLGGLVFADRDGDGVRGPYEEPLPGWRVTAHHAGALLGEARTDAEGGFAFDVEPGTGAVEVTVYPAEGWTTAGGGAATVECDREHGCPAPLLFAASGGEGAPPEAFRLEATYPNPFSRETTIRFTLPEAGAATLRVFDVLGREVARLVDGELEAGRHQVAFDGSALPSGVYVVQLAAGGEVAAERVTLLR